MKRMFKNSKKNEAEPINPYAKGYWERDNKYASLSEEKYNHNFKVINKKLAKEGKLKRIGDIDSIKQGLPHQHQITPLVPDDETARLIQHAKNIDPDSSTLERIHLDQMFMQTQKNAVMRQREQQEAQRKQEIQENKTFKKRYERARKNMKHVSQSFSDHYENHQDKYERAQNTLVPFIIGGSFIVMILELFYNYIMFYKTLIAVEPGLSKFYYIWALFTYILYFTGGILFFTERRFFFYHPYFFWFIAFASLVLMITSFVLEGVAVAEIKEEPKRKAAQIPVVVDMVFGILLCIFSFYFSYSLYDCHKRSTDAFCIDI